MKLSGMPFKKALYGEETGAFIFCPLQLPLLGIWKAARPKAATLNCRHLVREVKLNRVPKPTIDLPSPSFFMLERNKPLVQVFNKFSAKCNSPDPMKHN